MYSVATIQDKVREIITNFPWYKSIANRILHTQIEDSCLSIEKLPLLTSKILEEHYYSDDMPNFTGLSQYSTSGTSSGRRKIIYYSPEDEEQYIQIKTKLFSHLLKEHSVPLHKAMTDVGTGHAASTALTIFERLGYDASSLSFQLPIEQHITTLEQVQPEILYTMPSILDQIIYAAEDPHRFGIRKIILVGEVATPEWQSRIANTFSIERSDILDTYGSIEIGTIAHYSHVHQKYILAEGIYAEGITSEQLQEGFEPLQPNECVLVLTSFVRSCFPALRYVTYDVVRDLGITEVEGVPRQSFTCIAKRIGPELKHGEKISLYDIEKAVYGVDPRADVRVTLLNNKINVSIYSSDLELSQLDVVRQAIHHQIPEIGIMITSGILQAIEVTASNDPPPRTSSIKQKKIRYERS